MKFLILFAALCLSLASGQRITKQGTNADDTLITIKVPDANLLSEAKAVLRLYAITPFNPDQRFELPLTDSQLDSKAIYLRIEDNPKVESQFPTWSTTFSPANTFFNVNSYIAIEVWNDISPNGQAEVLQFIGGSIFTVKQLEQSPTTTSVALLNENGVYAGTADVYYSLPKNFFKN